MKNLTWLKKQTPTPEPEQVDRQTPDEGSNKSASSSISKFSESGMSKSDYGKTETDWLSENHADKNLIEATINAHFAVRRVIKDPVALALIKRLIEQGAV